MKKDVLISCVFLVFFISLVAAVDVSESSIGEFGVSIITPEVSTNYSLINVNNSDFWDGLDTPSDIFTGDLTDDNTYVEITGDTMTGDLIMGNGGDIIGDGLLDIYSSTGKSFALRIDDDGSDLTLSALGTSIIKVRDNIDLVSFNLYTTGNLTASKLTLDSTGKVIKLFGGGTNEMHIESIGEAGNNWWEFNNGDGNILHIDFLGDIRIGTTSSPANLKVVENTIGSYAAEIDAISSTSPRGLKVSIGTGSSSDIILSLNNKSSEVITAWGDGSLTVANRVQAKEFFIDNSIHAVEDFRVYHSGGGDWIMDFEIGDGDNIKAIFRTGAEDHIIMGNNSYSGAGYADMQIGANAWTKGRMLGDWWLDGDLNATGYYYGDISRTTGISGGNSSWNQSLADTLYMDIDEEVGILNNTDNGYNGIFKDVSITHNISVSNDAVIYGWLTLREGGQIGTSSSSEIIIGDEDPEMPYIDYDVPDNPVYVAYTSSSSELGVGNVCDAGATICGFSAGKCPYVYYYDGLNWNVINDIYPDVIGYSNWLLYGNRSDYLVIKDDIPIINGKIQLLLKETLREFSYTDVFKLYVVETNNNIVVDMISNELISYSNEYSPTSVKTNYGDDVSSHINSDSDALNWIDDSVDNYFNWQDERYNFPVYIDYKSNAVLCKEGTPYFLISTDACSYSLALIQNNQYTQLHDISSARDIWNYEAYELPIDDKNEFTLRIKRRAKNPKIKDMKIVCGSPVLNAQELSVDSITYDGYDVRSVFSEIDGDMLHLAENEMVLLSFNAPVGNYKYYIETSGYYKHTQMQFTPFNDDSIIPTQNFDSDISIGGIDG